MASLKVGGEKGNDGLKMENLQLGGVGRAWERKRRKKKGSIILRKILRGLKRVVKQHGQLLLKAFDHRNWQTQHCFMNTVKRSVTGLLMVVEYLISGWLRESYSIFFFFWIFFLTVVSFLLYFYFFNINIS